MSQLPPSSPAGVQYGHHCLISYTLTEILIFAKRPQQKLAPLCRVRFGSDEHGYGSVWGEHGELSWLVLQVSVVRETLVLQLLHNPPRKPPQASLPTLQ